MHSALVSSVRIFWNGCRELSDKERVHELKVNCHCIVASWHQCRDRYFFLSLIPGLSDGCHLVVWKIWKHRCFQSHPPCKIAKYQMGGKRRLPQANPVHQCRYLLLLWCSLNVLWITAVIFVGFSKYLTKPWSCCKFVEVRLVPLQSNYSSGGGWDGAGLSSFQPVKFSNVKHNSWSKLWDSCNHRSQEGNANRSELDSSFEGSQR